MLPALAIAVLAQATLEAGGPGWLGAALYLGAFALALRAAPASPPAVPARLERIAVPALLAAFVVVGLVELDRVPPLHIDEWAYHRAARMASADAAGGAVLRLDHDAVYSLERFRAQAAPLALHRGARALLGTGILPLRLASLACLTAALALGWAVARRVFGGTTALGALALALASPLALAHARPAHYIAASVLHGALCLWLLVRWLEAPSRARGVGLGAALGAGLVFYQLSWLVPAVVGLAALAARPGRALLRDAVPVLATAAAAAGVLALAVGDGLVEVWAQTADRGPLAPLAAPEDDAPTSAFETRLLQAPVPLPLESLQSAAERWSEAPDVVVAPVRIPEALSGLWLFGPPDRVAAVAGRLADAGWRDADAGLLQAPPTRRGPTMLARLFARPGPEFAGRWVAAPLLNPLVAPLLVVGLACAWRSRHPAGRALAVWVAVAALLPAMLGNPLPRRAVLVLPASTAIAAWPLARLAARRRGAALAGPWLAAAVALGVATYALRWNVPVEGMAPRSSLLALDRVLAELPRDRPVLVSPPATLVPLSEWVREVHPDAAGRIRVLARRDPRHALARACLTTPPFLLVGDDTPEGRTALAWAERRFAARVGRRDGFRVLSVTSRPPGACAPPDFEARE